MLEFVNQKVKTFNKWVIITSIIFIPGFGLLMLACKLFCIKCDRDCKDCKRMDWLFRRKNDIIKIIRKAKRT